MNVAQPNQAGNSSQSYSTKIQDKTVVVPLVNIPVAAEIDTNKDFFLSKDEVASYVTQGGEKPEASVLDDQTNEFQCAVAAVPNPFAAGYHSFDALIADYDKLAQENPNYVKKEILGKSPEGRDLVAYKFSEGAQGDTSSKLGVVITGCHHAREWMTVEAPLALGKSMLDGIAGDPVKQQRLHDSEVWIVPCVNPDGYEYSRNTDNMWRKNRSVQGVDQLGNPTEAIGVDLNRNYGDDTLNHHIVFRPDGDTPGNIKDDFGATSDDPFSEVYRGITAASEPEVKAMQELQLRSNIRGVLDFHSYGDDLLYPWSHTPVAPPEQAFYESVGGKVAAAGGYKLEPSIGLYPNSGSSDVFQEANGLRTFTFEMGKNFQPNPNKIPAVTKAASSAATVFVDEMINASKDGSLGERVALEIPAGQASLASGMNDFEAHNARTNSNAADRYFTPH